MSQEMFQEMGYQYLGEVTPRHSRSISHSRLSVGCEALDRDLFDPVPVFPQMGEVGVKWARLQTGWAKCERKRGEYDFSWLEDQVALLLDSGIQPWFNVTYGNPLYTPTDRTGVWAPRGLVPLATEEERYAWCRYVRTLVNHFKDRVQYYEVWNEPDHQPFWYNREPSGKDYASLFNITVRSIKEAWPEAKIVALAMTERAIKPVGQRFLTDFFTNVEDVSLIDAVSFHSYRYPPDAGYPRDVDRLRVLVDSFNPRIALWQGESGYPSQPGGTGAKAHNDQTSEKIQAKWLLRHVICNLGIDIALISWHQAVDLIGYQGSVNPKGLLRGEDYSPKPSFYAYQRLCSIFTGDVKADSWRWTTEEEEITGYSFANTKGQRLFAYWRPGDIFDEKWYETVTLRLSGVDTEILLVDLLNGGVYLCQGQEQDDSVSFHVPVGDYPLLLADRKVILYHSS